MTKFCPGGYGTFLLRAKFRLTSFRIYVKCLPSGAGNSAKKVVRWSNNVATLLTDQGSQFTSYEFTRTLRKAGVRISMDGSGRWMDNVMVEHLWRSLKYECVYLRELETGSDLRRALAWWFEFYNNRRPHFAFDGKKPMEIYQNRPRPEGVPPLAWTERAA